MAAEHRNVKARAVERSINRPVPSDWQRLITRSIEWRSMVAVLLSTQRIELKLERALKYDLFLLNSKHYPAVAALAARYLPIPATSVLSERQFSAAGRLITKLRSRLEPDRVDNILFLYKNL